MITCATYKSIVTRYPDAKIVGFTATPFKDNKLMTNYFNRISYTGSIKTFIDEGFLVEPRITAIENRSKSPESVIVGVTKLIADTERESKTIVYMDSLANCNYLRQALQVEGIDSEVITAGTTKDNREDAFHAFKKGKLNVLISVNVLTAGFDAPNVNCIIMPYRVGSASTYIQRIGRGLRPYENKDHCKIYVFGREPRLEKNFYEQLTEMVVTGRKERKEKTESQSDILTEQIKTELKSFQWDESFVSIFKALKVKGAEWTLDNLLCRNFPPILEAKIKEIHDSIMARKTKLEPEEASQAQKRFLQNLGLRGIDMDGLKKQEASELIFILHEKPKSPFILQSGLHKGKHIKETPFAYRSIMKKNAPTSEITALIRKWEQSCRAYKKENKR
jgi:superfamily II DNA or RNA helicase